MKKSTPDCGQKQAAGHRHSWIDTLSATTALAALAVLLGGFAATVLQNSRANQSASASASAAASATNAANGTTASPPGMSETQTPPPATTRQNDYG